MAGSIVQSAQNFSTTAGTTKAVTLTGTTAGNAIVVFAHDGSGTSKAMTCADNVNGSYGTQVDSLNDATNGNTLRSWVKGNIAGGSVTVTVSFPASDIFIGLYAAEVTGVSTAPLDGHHAQTQSVANGAAISSGAGTNASTAFMLSLSVRDDTSAAGSLPSVGTGFTVDPTFSTGVWNYGSGSNALVEYKASVAGGSNSAAFVNGSGSTGTFNTLMVMLDESSGSNVSVNLTGQTATFTEGSLTETIDYTPSAQTATFTEGSLTEGVSYGLTAQTGTLTEGSLTDAVSYGLTAQTATFSEGTITVSTGGDVSLNLGAQTATFSEGTISPALSAALSAQSITSSEGTPTATFSYGLAAQTATFSEGTVTPQVTGDVTIQLSALQATLALGQITATGGDQPVSYSNAPGLGGSGGDRWSSKFEFRRRKRDPETESIETLSTPVPRGTLPVARQIDENVATQLKNALQLPPSEDEDEEEAFSMLLQAEDAIRTVAVQQLQALMGRLKQ